MVIEIPIVWVAGTFMFTNFGWIIWVICHNNKKSGKKENHSSEVLWTTKDKGK